MKKNIALFISIIALIFLILSLRITINKDDNNDNSKLNGNVISEGIYGYDLETENLSVNGVTCKNNEIYYLLIKKIRHP